jgi:phosphoribosylformylglycinamidine synthase
MYALWDGPGKQDAPQIKGKYTLEETLCMVMADPDVASKEWFFRQKDSSVKGATIQGPLIGLKQEVEADATIQKPLETQAPYKDGKDFGAIAYAAGIAPKISDLDAYHSAQISFVDMVGKIVAVGGALPDMTKPKWDAWAVCGNYCQPNSESQDTLTRESGARNLASLLREAIGMREAEEALNIPVISGKDSMKCSCVYEVGPEFKLEDVPADLRRHINLVERDGKRKIEIHDPDTTLVSCAVKIDDYRKCVNSALKKDGDLIYVIGTTKNHLGASELLRAVGYREQGAPIEGGKCPKVDFNELIKNCNAVHEAIDQELVASCSGIHAGGLGAALAKAAMAGAKGANLDIARISQDGSCSFDEELLYSRTPGRFMVTVDKKDADRLAQILMKHNVQYSLVGEVRCSGMEQRRLNGATETIEMAKVKEAYKKPLRFDLDMAA